MPAPALSPPTREPSRLRGLVAKVLMRLFGRPIVCADCGRPIFRGVPLPWRGGVRIIGAADGLVRISFSTQDILEFRHVHADQCPSPERPWVR